MILRRFSLAKMFLLSIETNFIIEFYLNNFMIKIAFLLLYNLNAKNTIDESLQ